MKPKKVHLIKPLPAVALFIFCLLVHITLGYRLKIGYVLTIFPIFLLLNNVDIVYRVLLIALSIVALIHVSTGLVYSLPNFNSTLYSYRDLSQYQSALGVI